MKARREDGAEEIASPRDRRKKARRSLLIALAIAAVALVAVVEMNNRFGWWATDPEIGSAQKEGTGT